ARAFRSPPVQQGHSVVRAAAPRRRAMRHVLGGVDTEHVRDQRIGSAFGRMLLAKVCGELLLSPTTVCLSEASADEARAVADNPLSTRSVEVKARGRAASWHLRTISRRAAGVT